MPSYTITATFHVDVDSDSTLTEDENYESMISFFQSAVDGHGAYLVRIDEIEED